MRRKLLECLTVAVLEKEEPRQGETHTHNTVKPFETLDLQELKFPPESRLPGRGFTQFPQLVGKTRGQTMMGPWWWDYTLNQTA